MKKIFCLLALLLMSLNISGQVALEGGPDFGRLEDLTYHPTIENRVYAVTLRSHIVVSNDNGLNWDFFYSFPDENVRIQQLDYLGNSSLSFFTTQSSTISSNTIYILNINTATISKQYTPPATPSATLEWIKNYDIYKTNTDVIIVNDNYKIGGAVHYMVYYSINGGDSWTVIYNGDLNSSVSVNNVAINPSSPNNLLISRGPGPTEVDGGLLISDDAGVTFTEALSGIELGYIKFDPSNTNTVYLGTGWSGDSNLYKSIDGGLNWNIEPITWDTSGVLEQINYIEINQIDANEMIVLAGDEIAITSDGGVNWSNYAYDIDDTSSLYVYGMKASYNPFNDGEVMIATDKYPVNSLDGGATLTQVENPFHFSEFVSFNPNNGGHLYFGAQSGIVHKDMTTGIHSVNQEYPLGTFTVNPKSYYPDEYTAGRIYYRLGAGLSGNLLLMENHGANIVRLLVGSFTSHIIDVETDPIDTNYIWVSFDDGITRLVNTAVSNSSIEITLPVPNPDPTAPLILHFTTFINPVNSDHVLIGQGGRVYESLDRGINWTEKSNGIDAYLNADWDIVYDIEQNPNNANEFVASTSQGIFKTVDFGENWTMVYAGTYLRKIAYSTTNSDVLIASVYSSQTTQTHLVYSLDNGLNWDVIPPSVLEYVGSGSMTYQFESGYIHVYIATYDSSVIKYTIDIDSLSIPDYLTEESLRVYPNPSSDIINIYINNGITIKSIEMFNLNGQKVIKAEFNNKVDISSLQDGIYLLRLTDNEGNYYIKKILKK